MNDKRKNLIGGLILIALGTLALFNQFFEIPALENIAIGFVAILGAIFLAAGVIKREAGFLIPGGILSGIGWGIILIAGPWFQRFVHSQAEGGIFMLAFAAGWVSITIFTALFAEETHWWALIPGGIMALIGGALFFQGGFLTALELLGSWWPLILIVMGIVTLFSARKVQDKEKDPDSLKLDI